MPYNTVITFSAGNTVPAADLNNNFQNLDYLNAKINSQIQLSAGALVPRITSGASPGQIETTAGRNYSCMDFPDGSVTSADFSFVLPSDYNGGTMTAIFNWTANSTSTNSVKWFIYMVGVADDETLNVSSSTTQNVVDANKSTAYDYNKTAATPAITIGGTPSAGELLWGRVYRDPTDGSDTLAATARLLSVVLTYTRN